MSVKSDLGKCKELVEEVLQRHKAARNNDSILFLWVWFEQGFGSMANAYADAINNGAFNPESIRRRRQELQAANPKLRGKSYKLRHADAESIKGDMYRGVKRGKLTNRLVFKQKYDE